MTISQDKALILIWPLGLPDGTVLRLDRTYVETKCEWQELTDRVASWRIKN